MDMVDIANATLSGGVAVGAVADLMLGPAGAFAAGTVMGLISTLGFQKLQSFLHDKLKYTQYFICGTPSNLRYRATTYTHTEFILVRTGKR